MKTHTKVRTNVAIPAELLAEAKANHLNLSRLLEEKIRETLRDRQAEAWKAENRAAIAAWNRFTEEQGLWSDGQRLF
jgi:antitoxin CcdA